MLQLFVGSRLRDLPFFGAEAAVPCHSLDSHWSGDGLEAHVECHVECHSLDFHWLGDDADAAVACHASCEADAAVACHASCEADAAVACHSPERHVLPDHAEVGPWPGQSYQLYHDSMLVKKKRKLN